MQNIFQYIIILSLLTLFICSCAPSVQRNIEAVKSLEPLIEVIDNFDPDDISTINITENDKNIVVWRFGLLGNSVSREVSIASKICKPYNNYTCIAYVDNNQDKSYVYIYRNRSLPPKLDFVDRNVMVFVAVLQPFFGVFPDNSLTKKLTDRKGYALIEKIQLDINLFNQKSKLRELENAIFNDFGE